MKANFDIQQEDLSTPFRNEGRKHLKLKEIGKKVLSERGYHQIGFEAIINPQIDKRGLKADVIGFYGTKSACVECETGRLNGNHFPSSLEKKIPHFDFIYILHSPREEVKLINDFEIVRRNLKLKILIRDSKTIGFLRNVDGAFKFVKKGDEE